jgi:hypothetical protein
MVVVVFASLLIPVMTDGGLWALSAVVVDVAAIAALLIVARRTTDGEWGWRWRKN